MYSGDSRKVSPSRMNSTSESNSRAWRLIVGVLPIEDARSMTVRSRPAAAAYSRARGTVWSLAPSSTRITWRGRRLCRASDARQWMMLSSSLNAGMTTSTIAFRQSSAGVGTVLSGPRSSPMLLSSTLGLMTNQGAVAIFFPDQALAFDGDEVIDRLFQRVAMFEFGQVAQPVQAGTTATDVLEVLPVGFAQPDVADGGAAAGAFDHQPRQIHDADLAIVADIGDDGVGARTVGERIECDDGVAHVAERPRLRTAAEYRDGFVAHGLGDEPGHDHAVAAHLSRPHGVKETCDHRGDAEALRIGQPQRLVGDLADRIAPAGTGTRAPPEILVFAQDLLVVVAVDLGTGRQHHLRFPAPVARRAQHAFAAGDVGGEHLGRLGQHAVDADDGRQVVDAVGPAHDAVQPVPGQDVGFIETKVGVVFVGGKIGALSRRQIVDHVHLVAARKVQVHQVRADEARPAGNQDMHAPSPRPARLGPAGRRSHRIYEIATACKQLTCHGAQISRCPMAR